MDNPIFASTVSAKSVTVGERYLANHNKLLWQVEGADGVKTGYTKAAGRILVGSATRNGRRLISVTINAPDDWHDHAVLMEQGFRRYAVRQLVCQGQTLGTVEVAGGQAGIATVHAGEDFFYAVADNEAVTVSLSGAGFVYAPVAAGQNAGYAHVLLNGNPVGKVSIYYGETVEREPEPERSWWQKILGR